MSVGFTSSQLAHSFFSSQTSVLMMDGYDSLLVQYNTARAYLEARRIGIRPNATLTELEWAAQYLMIHPGIPPLAHRHRRELVCFPPLLIHPFPSL